MQFLRAINAAVSAKVIGYKAGDGIVKQMLTSEKLDAHNSAGQGSIGGSGKDGDKAHGCE